MQQSSLLEFTDDALVFLGQFVFSLVNFTSVFYYLC